MSDQVFNRTARGAWVPAVALGAVALLPLAQMGHLAWPQYARLWVAAPGLGYLLWRYLRPAATPAPGLVGPLVTLGFMYVVHQFRGEAAAAPLLAGVVGLSLVAALGGLLSAGSVHLTRADAVAAAAALILVLPGGSKALAGGQPLPWDLLARAGASLLLWFAVTRTLRVSPAAARAVALSLVGVLAVVAAYGAVQVASVRLSRLRSESARTAGELDRAAHLFDSALARAGRLGLDGLADGLAFQLAGVLQARGHSDQAAGTLGLQPGFVQVTAADAWEGPEGGNLYYLVSCWKDLTLHPGEVQLVIYASGTPADDVWPLMRVKLDQRVLSDVPVTSTDARPYSLTVQVPRPSRQRLEVLFLNDYHQAEPYQDRNLRVHQAEVRYRQIYWE
ncbi:MAG: carbohydrate-binding domain-containing protein [Candidatus Latescibacterota bacterium]